MTTSLNHFNSIKSNMKLSFNKFMYSDTNENGVLSHHYLIPGPLEATFSTIPYNSGIKVYVLEIKKMNVTVEN